MTTIDNVGVDIPCNATTGTAYKGGNVLRLLAAADAAGYGPGGWAGYRQWLAAGRQVRKGEHGTSCLTVVTVADGKTGRLKTVPRGFRVFHVDQTETVGPAPMSGDVQ